MKNKNKFASKNSHQVPDVHNFLLINDVGREEWGAMTNDVEYTHIMTDAHLLFEILDEEKIPCKLHGMCKNHLPISKLESAPVA